MNTKKIDGIKIQQIMDHWDYNGFRMLIIYFEEGYYILIATNEDGVGVKTKGIQIDWALNQLEKKIDEDYL